MNTIIWLCPECGADVGYRDYECEECGCILILEPAAEPLPSAVTDAIAEASLNA